MAIGTSLSLSKDTATDVDTNLTVFDLRAGDLDHSEYSVAGLTLPAKKVFSISHLDTKAGNVRSKVGIDRTEVDANLIPATVSVYMVIDRPPSTAITNAVILEVANQMVDFLIEGGVNANVTKVLNRET